jgi:flagellar basal-body rod protein FlgB
MIQGLFQSGSMQSLEHLTRFTSARHDLLTHNIANLTTPHHRAVDLSPEQFQASLRDAVDRRRRGADPVGGELQLRDDAQMRVQGERVTFRPHVQDGVLFHDRGSRDLERTMQSLAENTLTHNAALELLRNQFDLLRAAIRERP